MKTNTQTIMKTNTQNNKGFTLIELIIVTIILGILAAVAIPRYTVSVEKAEEAAENAVISSIRSGLENYATERLMAHGRREWPANPFDALAETPAGYAVDIFGHPTNSGDAASDGEWTYNTIGDTEPAYGFGTYDGSITHMRGDNTVKTWRYNNGNMSSGYEAVGSLGS
jgi:prepilin-type N-terminal cleavage/methylation domain-containing protein